MLFSWIFYTHKYKEVKYVQYVIDNFEYIHIIG